MHPTFVYSPPSNGEDFLLAGNEEVGSWDFSESLLLGEEFKVLF